MTGDKLRICNFTLVTTIKLCGPVIAKLEFSYRADEKEGALCVQRACVKCANRMDVLHKAKEVEIKPFGRFKAGINGYSFVYCAANITRATVIYPIYNLNGFINSILCFTVAKLGGNMPPGI